MSTTYTYPGVYIQEISNGQHTITGVATSIAAFVGWTNQGPAGSATMVESWAEYSALFGGLIPGNYLGYAVYQFFGNGGSQAYIVRLADATAATAGSVIGGLQLYANNPGAWANGISVQIYNVTPNANSTDLTFNLKITITSTKQVVESYTNLSVLSTSPNFAVTTINNDSNYISFTAPGSTTPPAFLPFYSVAGAVAVGPAFDVGETVTQPGTTATSTLLGFTPSGAMLLGPISKVADGTKWTGNTSTATFNPTAAPAIVVVAAGPTALNAGTSPTSGADGNTLIPNTAPFETALSGANGFQLLANVPIFNLLCVPGENNSAVVAGGTPSLLQFCHDHRAFLIIDVAQNASKSTLQSKGPVDFGNNTYSTLYPSYGGFYYPWISAPDPQAGFRPTLFPPCGYVAGAFAATDASRGVWKAPAGIGANLSGALGLQTVLSDADQGLLNPVAVNCLRQFMTYGNVIWGARTLDGADDAGSQWKYIPIRRLAMYHRIEPLRRHAMGGLRAQCRTAVGAGAAEHRHLPAGACS